jgi:N-glycosylase/DNA lyase
MTRVISLIIDERLVQREMHEAYDELLPGVLWGDPWSLFTPAYWLAQAWMTQADRATTSRYCTNGDLVNELGFCMLGGFGITAELASAAFERCRDAGLFNRLETCTEVWLAQLSERFWVNDRFIKYRYPNQKAKFLAAAMLYAKQHTFKFDSPLTLRNQLLEITGVGYKTASWVVRNVLDSDDVAILDVHLIRAGRLCGLYSEKDNVQHDYLSMECRFLSFSRGLQLRPAVLDCLIWDEMRAAGQLPIDMLNEIEQRSSAGDEGLRRESRTVQRQLRL